MKTISIAIAFLILLNSCATVFGGAKYHAHIIVPNHPNVSVLLNGEHIGNSNSIIKIKRADASFLNFEVQKEGYVPENYYYRSKKVRGVAVGFSIFFSLFTRLTIFSNNGVIYNRAFPIQIFIDMLNYSSIFKPDDKEKGLIKMNYNNYKYVLPFRGELINPPKIETSKTLVKDELTIQQEKLRDLKIMYDENIIDNIEYDMMRKNILDDQDLNPKAEEDKSSINNIDNTFKIDSVVENINKDESIIEPKLNDKEKERLNDLNKMLEIGIISQQEYDEMKGKLIYNEQ